MTVGGHCGPGSPFPAQGLGPFGSEFRPTDPDQLFVTNAHNGAGLGTVSVFNDARVAVPDRRLPVRRPADRAVLGDITPDGRYLFAVNTGSGAISRYTIAPDGSSPYSAPPRSAPTVVSAPSIRV